MTARSKQNGLRGATVVLGLGLALGACAQKADVTASLAPIDTRERHPIVLRDAPRSIDVFVGRAGAGLDARQAEDVAAFAQEYRRSGRGGLVAEVPTGTRREMAAHDTLNAIRAQLARGGAPGGLSVRTYRVTDPELASPIRLSFASLQAGLPHSCGQWPEDTGVSNFRSDAANTPYWNLGCATQATLAAQVADPIDLVRSRTEGRPDVGKRMADVARIRQAQDPSTAYRQNAASINATFGQR
jgi:pilus assembly protein CpaD